MPASPRSRRRPGHEVYEPTPAQVAEWKKAAEPLEEKWAENVKKAGGDPDAVMKELKAQLSKARRRLLMQRRR